MLQFKISVKKTFLKNFKEIFYTQNDSSNKLILRSLKIFIINKINLQSNI